MELTSLSDKKGKGFCFRLSILESSCMMRTKYTYVTDGFENVNLVLLSVHQIMLHASISIFILAYDIIAVLI